MSTYIIQSSRIMPYHKRPKQVPGFVSAYAYEPPPEDKAAQYGSYYLVIEVLFGGRKAEELAELIIETFGHSYYDESLSNASSDLRFETAIRALNNALSEHAKSGNASWIGKISAVVAVLNDGMLYTSGTGSAEAYLYRAKKTIRIPFSLSTDNNLLHTFGSISSGDISENDKILISTPALHHQLQLPQLKAIITGHTPSGAINEISALLAGSSGERVGAVILNVTTPDEASRTLSDTNQNNTVYLNAPSTIAESAKISFLPITNVSKSLLIRSYLISKKYRSVITPEITKLINILKIKYSKIYSGKNRSRNTIITVILVLLTLILSSMYVRSAFTKISTINEYKKYYSNFKNSNIESKDYISLTTETQKYLSNLSNDEIKTINASLDNKTESVGDFKQAVIEHNDELSSILSLNSNEIVDINDVLKTTDVFLETLGTDAVIVTKSPNPSFIVVDLTTNKVKTSAVDSSKLGNITATTKTKNRLILATSKSGLWEYDPNVDAIKLINISYGEWEKVSSLSFYLGNIYTIADSQIYKHTSTYSGFSPKEPYELGPRVGSDPLSLAIDGDIYTISDKQLVRYRYGKAITRTPLPDGLVDTKSIWKNATTGALVGFDSTSQHIGVWDVSSEIKFNAQYYANDISKITALSLSTTASEIIALSSNKKLYKINLSSND